MWSLISEKSQSTFPRGADGVGVSAVYESPDDLVVAARLNFVEDRIAGVDAGLVLGCEMRDALGFVKFSVDQVVRRLESH